MEEKLMSTNGLANYQNQKQVGLLKSINIWGHISSYNPLEKQLSYNPENGEVEEWKVKPYNKVDEIAAHHDICGDMGRNKGECDKEMVKSLDNIPYGEMPKWGSTARFLINTKQKLDLDLKSKNVKRR